MEHFIKITKALSDPTRVRILGLLLDGELCVCNIVEVMSFAQPTISKHLKQCTDAGLTTSRKEGGWTHYRLTTETDSPFIPLFIDLLKQAIRDDACFSELQTKLTALNRAKTIHKD